MKPRQWRRVELRLKEAYQDLIIGQLAALGFDGFSQDGMTLHAYIRSKSWSADLRAQLEHTLSSFGTSFPDLDTAFSIATIREENWNKRWEQSSGIVEATDRILIKPSWKKLRKKDQGKIVLHIDPKMSFGTGHHETTRLSLSLLEEYVRKGMTVLDFGCGTGILAIAAVKLGARQSDAVDVDDWAITNTKENVRRNRCTARINVRQGDVRALPRKRYDLIVSNTDVPTLNESFPMHLSALKPGGSLLVSGLMTSDLESFLAMAAGSSLVALEVLSENEWAALSFLAPDAPRRN
ncbi:MAG: 50S ribosomal protein L11 methyltransferase [Proteobacteria bacterium]|nr:50S ribosomal protein L11 methyltransferase [Pseudomonadota bacterium]